MCRTTVLILEDVDKARLDDIMVASVRMAAKD